jgi:hypothetical protein
LKNVQFCSRPRKAKILTTGILVVFRGLKFESDAGIGQKGAFCEGFAQVSVGWKEKNAIVERSPCIWTQMRLPCEKSSRIKIAKDSSICYSI